MKRVLVELGRKICLLGLGIIIVACVGEVYLRLLNAPTAHHFLNDYELYYSPEPGACPSSENPAVLETIGADGMRVSRPAITYNKPHTALVSGCSFTYGMGVPDEETYVWKLDESCPSTDFDNCGVGGYGPYSCLVRQKRYLARRKYDLVIYAMIHDHHERDARSRHTFVYDDRADMVALQYVELHDSGFYEIHPPETNAWPGDRYSCLINFLRNFSLSLKVRMRPVPSEAKMHTIFAWLVNNMAAQAQRYGAQFALVVLTSNPVSKHMFSPDVNIIEVPHSDGDWFPPEHCVLNNPKNHPNGILHAHWAKAILYQLQQRHLLEYSAPRLPVVNSDDKLVNSYNKILNSDDE